MEESEIERIVEKTIESHENKRIDKIWKNPRRAQSTGLLLLAVAFLGWAMFGMHLTIDYSKDSSPVIESLLENMDCQSLKDAMSDNDIHYYKHQNMIKNQMLVKCM